MEDDHIVDDSNMMCAFVVAVAVVELVAATTMAADEMAHRVDSCRIVSANLHTLQSAECLCLFRKID